MKYIILNLYDEQFPIIVTDEESRPIIFNSYEAAKGYSVIVEYSQIVPLDIDKSEVVEYENN